MLSARHDKLVAEGVVGDPVHVESWFGYNLSGPFGAAMLADASHWVHALPGRLFHNNIDHMLNKVGAISRHRRTRRQKSFFRKRLKRTGAQTLVRSSSYSRSTNKLSKEPFHRLLSRDE